jgi:hypothetical protein
MKTNLIASTGEMGLLVETPKMKTITSKSINMIFDKTTGFTATWGETKNDDPDVNPFGPTIFDMEITTICGKGCSFCYKGNTKNGKNMTFETFKKIFHNLPKTITQIAFGADAYATSNPDLWRIMDYCRNNEYNYVVPNITIADITDETADMLVQHVGAVAVSRYADKNICYDSVKRLTERGLKQTNIHQVIMASTFDQTMETLRDIKTDPRLSGLNAIVFLSLKQKGRGVKHERISNEQYQMIIDTAFELGIRFGMDSCGAKRFIDASKNRPDFKKLFEMVEPCESSCHSAYCDTDGLYYPCSFTEKGIFDNAGDWTTGVDLTVEGLDFNKDVWNNPKTIQFRKALLNNKDENGVRCCPLYNV